MTYRTFVRLPDSLSGLQSTIRSIKAETLEKIHIMLSKNWLDNGDISLEKLRVDSARSLKTIQPPHVTASY